MQESSVKSILRARTPSKASSTENKRTSSSSSRRGSVQPAANRKLRSRTRSEGHLKNIGAKDTNDPLDWLRPSSAIEKEDTRPGDTSFGFDSTDLDSSFTKFLQVFRIFSRLDVILLISYNISIFQVSFI